MSEQSPAEGWYPIDDLTERFWNGTAWSDATRPRHPRPATAPQVASSESATPQGHSTVVTAGIVAVSVIGLIMSIQSASLLTGTGLIWTGVAVAVGAAVFAFILKARRWVRVVAVIFAVIGFASAAYVESQLADQRAEFSDIGF